MTEIKVPYTPVWTNNLGKGLLIGKTDMIDPQKAKVKWRVMLEQEYRFIPIAR